VTRSVLDQDTEDDDDDDQYDISTGSTTSFVVEDGEAYASDEENIAHIVA
jgi:hypothetical protein